MGTKKQPLHALVSHGSVTLPGPPPPQDLRGLSSWFQGSPEGRVEGIVWHCDDGSLVKVSRALHVSNVYPQKLYISVHHIFNNAHFIIS